MDVGSARPWCGETRGYGTPNADVMLGVVDPADNYVYEVHQYLDSNYSGTHPECRNEIVGVTTLRLSPNGCESITSTDTSASSALERTRLVLPRSMPC